MLPNPLLGQLVSEALIADRRRDAARAAVRRAAITDSVETGEIERPPRRNAIGWRRAARSS
jgi:hypothetical protein